MAEFLTVAAVAVGVLGCLVYERITRRRRAMRRRIVTLIDLYAPRGER